MNERRPRQWKLIRILACGGAALHGAAGAAWAQKTAGVVEPESNMLTMVIGIAVLVVASLPGFLNAKRSHLN